MPRPAFTVDEGLIKFHGKGESLLGFQAHEDGTNSDSITSLATGCSGFPNITPRRSASVSESAGAHITGLPREVAALSIWMRATRITPGWSLALPWDNCRGDMQRDGRYEVAQTHC